MQVSGDVEGRMTRGALTDSVSRVTRALTDSVSSATRALTDSEGS